MIGRIARRGICAAIGERISRRAITPISPVRICAMGSIRVCNRRRGERIGTRAKMRAKMRPVIRIRCVTVVADHRPSPILVVNHRRGVDSGF